MNDERDAARADAEGTEHAEGVEQAEATEPAARPARGSEDVWAVLLGTLILAAVLAAVWAAKPADFDERLERSALLERDAVRLEDSVREARASGRPAEEIARLDAESAAVASRIKELERIPNPFARLIAKAQVWRNDVSSALPRTAIGGIAVVFGSSLALFGIAFACLGVPLRRFAPAFTLLFAMALLADILASQAVIRSSNLEYPLWALLVGLAVSNTIGTPAWLRPALRSELYIKTGLVLLGSTVLFGKLVALGKPGIVVSWIATPIVLIGTYAFGQKVLRMTSRTLNITISAEMSVCGVSAAIATAAACRAKKEELSLAIALSLFFTVIMMVAMPAFILATGMDRVVGAAWIGGTIDATGAVAAAGEKLGADVLPVAATVKMIQNILIGVISFAVSVYWVAWVEPASGRQRASAWEIWRRFPKFILGFIAASAVFSWVHGAVAGGPQLVDAAVKGAIDIERTWFFTLAFVSIGLETNFRELARTLQGGKPLVLYIVGQSFNLALTYAAAHLMFRIVFPEAAEALRS